MRAALALLLLAGCGNTGENAVSEEVACADLVKAVCGQLQACSDAAVKLYYGDQATCEARLTVTCKSSLHDPGTTLTTNRLDACAKKTMAATCTALANHVVPDECKAVPGTLANGSACGDDGQCQSAYCKKAAKAACGVCAARDATCVRDDDCDSGLVCANMACVARGAQGASCDAGHPCGYGLTCEGGACQTPPGAGMTCTASASGGSCDQAQGYFCNPVSNVCQAFSFANAGEPCGLVNQGYAVCAANGRCTSMLNGNCLAAAADGAACDDTNGPNCQSPSQCINSVWSVPLR